MSANLTGGMIDNVGLHDGSVDVFLQLPASPGQFQSPVSYSGTTHVVWVAVGDMNGDGKPDLVIADGGIQIRFQESANPGKFLVPTAIASQ